MQTPAAATLSVHARGSTEVEVLLIKPHSTEVGPPLGNASDKLAASAVQELRIANARPSIATGEKFLFNSLL